MYYVEVLRKYYGVELERMCNLLEVTKEDYINLLLSEETNESLLEKVEELFEIGFGEQAICFRFLDTIVKKYHDEEKKKAIQNRLGLGGLNNTF